MKVLVTGAAGFIGSYVCHALLNRGFEVSGLDSLNAYYDPGLKARRLEFLEPRAGFRFHTLDIADHEALASLFTTERYDTVIHLAAQAGVRHSLDNPFAYAESNLTGHLSVLEAVRHAAPRPFLVYASSSSVYGNSTPAPFCEDARVDSPVSLYAATKRSGELLSESYANLYGMAQVGLRFFTVYGPWGRPDMAYWTFARKILDGEPIEVFNSGDLKRDFTWIDDIVDGVARIAERGPLDGGRLHRIYNIGNNRPERLTDFIAALERALGETAERVMLPMQPGDVYETAADITAIQTDYGFAPATRMEDGLARFAEWFRAYRAGRADTWRQG
ncbi:NAD-dependent epimerase/dehydratase family protein [Glycocaulis profundi]|nr:NAD-dependent epimerase/dehydratase family protein [Glycocaulis profundi]